MTLEKCETFLRQAHVAIVEVLCSHWSFDNDAAESHPIILQQLNNSYLNCYYIADKQILNDILFTDNTLT